MHFSVPDSQELYSETTGTTYTAYNIYINGAFHCALRYKQLHSLHEQLRRRNDGITQLPDFPPKRLLPLTNGQLETRRVALEHYLQLVGQDGRMAKAEHFQNFLLNAQYETALAEGVLDEYNGVEDGIQSTLLLDVELMNGVQLRVNCRMRDNASDVLQKVCQAVKLPQHIVPYFCLFLSRREGQNELLLLRRLMDFEAPFLSQLRACTCRIVLRTGYWNPSYDMLLLQDPVALNLLYAQTVADVEREWVITPPEMRPKLHSLQDHGMKKEFMEIVRRLPLYGCLQFYAAHVDYYADDQCSALISIGNKELSMRMAKGAKIYETKFRVTRMRCWRVTAVHNTTLDAKDTLTTNLQLSFEYLMSKQTLRWITITSAQAMLMSVCLQAMVDELLNTKDPKMSMENGYNTPTTAQPSMTGGGRCGLYSQSTISTSSSSHSFSNDANTTTTNTTISITPDSSCSSPTAMTTTTTTCSTPTQAPVQFIAQRRAGSHNPKIFNVHSYAAVFYRNAQTADAVQQNEAFEGIGNEDL